MNEQIKEITEIINKRCEAELDQVHTNSRNGKVTKTVDTSLIAKDIISAGYHKMIWHKVADGDFPDSEREILIATKSGNVESGQYNDFTCEDGVNRFRFIDRFYDFVDDVIAWAYLPEHKE